MTVLLKDKFGYTLIETMIVMVLIGIIGAIAVPVYRSYTTNVRCSEARNLIDGAITSAETYFVINRTYIGWSLSNDINIKAKYFILGNDNPNDNLVKIKATGNGKDSKLDNNAIFIVAVKKTGQVNWETIPAACQ